MDKRRVNEPVTVLDFLNYAVGRFKAAKLHFGHGTTHALDEAAYLILHTMNLPLEDINPYLNWELTFRQRKTLRKIIEKRLIQRIPAAYLTHEAWLGDFSFHVDRRVVIPRSFIAELLREKLSSWISHPGKIKNALDLCTGSGCLAIMMAHAFPSAGVDATDISRRALDVARINVNLYKLGKRIRLIPSDFFRGLKGRRYDLIICNPPYVDARTMKALPAEYHHEPRLALASGQDGLDALRVILKEAVQHLRQDGLLVVEIGNNRKTVEKTFLNLPFIWPQLSNGEDTVFILSRDDLA